MKNRKWTYMALVFVLAAVLLAGCGAEASRAPESYNGKSEYLYGGIYDSADSIVAESVPAASGHVSNTTTSGSVGSAGVQNQKLIRTMHVEAETNDLDILLVTLDAKIAELKGYVENKSVYNGSYSDQRSYRTATLTIRIPVDRLDAFIEHVKGASNIISHKENADDITLSYVATASRISALETEQQRLLELLAKAETMDDLLMIEQRLTDVRTELEQVTSQLRLYDNLVDYGTVELSVTQVQEFTVVEEESVWQRMGSGLKENWKGLCEFAEDLLVLIVSSLPLLIPVGLAVLLIFAVIKLCARPRKKKETPEKPQ